MYNSAIVQVERKDIPATPTHAIPQSPSGTIGTGQKQEHDFL